MSDREKFDVCDAEFWKRHPMQLAKLDDAKYDSTHIMLKLAEF